MARICNYNKHDGSLNTQVYTKTIGRRHALQRMRAERRPSHRRRRAGPGGARGIERGSVGRCEQIVWPDAGPTGRTAAGRSGHASIPTARSAATSPSHACVVAARARTGGADRLKPYGRATVGKGPLRRALSRFGPCCTGAVLVYVRRRPNGGARRLHATARPNSSNVNSISSAEFERNPFLISRDESATPTPSFVHSGCCP